jgi:hypothetical protein
MVRRTGVPVPWQGDLTWAGTAEHAREHHRVQRTPGVELLPVDAEPVRGRPPGEAVAHHPVLLVAFQTGQRLQCLAHLGYRPAGRGGDLGDGQSQAA